VDTKQPEAAMIPERVLKALGSCKALRHWMVGRIPGTPAWWWDISKPITCAHQGAWMRCRKDEAFRVCSSLTRGEEEGIVPTCKKFHLCAWNWGNEEDRPEGLRARAYAYYVAIHPEEVDGLRRHIWSHGVGEKAACAAAGTVIKDLWEGDVDAFLDAVAIQRTLRDRYLEMITDDIIFVPPLSSEAEQASKELEDLIPVGLAGRPLLEDGLPVPTAVYLSRLDPLAGEVAPDRSGQVMSERPYPWRGSRSAPRPEPPPALEESEEDREEEEEEEREVVSEEEEESETEQNPGKKPPVGGRGVVVGGVLE
jgi:hypothetical protein